MKTIARVLLCAVVLAMLWMVGTTRAEEIDITAKKGGLSVSAFSRSTSVFRSGYITGFLHGVFLRDAGVQNVCSMSGVVLEAHLDTDIRSGEIKPTDSMDLALYGLLLKHGCKWEKP